MAKRTNGEGTVYKTSTGKWRAQVNHEGKRLSFSADKKHECLKWIRETQNKIDQGLTLRGSEMSLKEYLNEWLKMIASSRKKSTFRNYSWIVSKRILPHLGNQKLRNLRPDRIQKFYDTLLNKENRSAHQVLCIHKTLHSAFKHACNLGYLARNPIKGTTPPKPRKKEMGFYTEKQVQVLLDTALQIEDRFHPLYYLAVHTGMRQAELLGLKWSDVNWEKSTIRVSRQVAHFKGGGYTFSSPKSKAGVRTIILGTQAIEVLKAQQKRLESLKTACAEWTELNLIFPSIVGTPMTAYNLRRSFRRLLEASGLPKVRFHDLRHTAASLMLNHGIPVLIVSRRLGHSKPSITMDVYGHIIPSKQEEAALLMDSLIKAT